MVAKESSRESLASGTWRTPSKDKLLHNMIPRINLPKSTNQQISIVIAFWDCFFLTFVKKYRRQSGNLWILGFGEIWSWELLRNHVPQQMLNLQHWTYMAPLLILFFLWMQIRHMVPPSSKRVQATYDHKKHASNTANINDMHQNSRGGLTCIYCCTNSRYTIFVLYSRITAAMAVVGGPNPSNWWGRTCSRSEKKTIHPSTKGRSTLHPNSRPRVGLRLTWVCLEQPSLIPGKRKRTSTKTGTGDSLGSPHRHLLMVLLSSFPRGPLLRVSLELRGCTTQCAS